MLDTTVVVYLDDILIFTHEAQEERYWREVRKVLTILRNYNLYVNLGKYEFVV